MKLPDGARRWFVLPKRLADIARQIDEELDFHIESRTEELMRSGLPRGAARARAIQEFGDMQQARTELGAIDTVQVARSRRAEWWSGVAQDLKFAWRGIRRQPGFALMIVATLGVGLGLNATTFDLVDRLLFRAPKHVAAPESIRRLYLHETNPWAGPATQPATTYPDFVNVRDGTKTMDIGAYMGTEGTMGRGRDAEAIDFVAASASYFSVLGVRPYLGRFYTDREDAPPHGEALAVLSYEFWQRRFGGARDVLGRQVLIGKKNFTIIGVTPPGFTGIELRPMDAWLPVTVIAEEWGDADWPTSKNMAWLRMVGRLKPSATDQQAAQEATAVWRRGGGPRTATDSTAHLVLGPVQQARGAWESEDTRNGQVAGWLAGVSVLVLLVACANVGNLLLTRAIRLRRETALRLALGVGRMRLLRSFLIESLLLCLLAAIAAILLSIWGGNLLRSLLFTNLTWNDSGLNTRLLVFLGIAMLFTTMTILLPPAIQMMRENIIPALKSGARAGYARSRVRTTLLFIQAAFSVILLIGAALFVRSFQRVSSMSLGFDPATVLIADIDLGLVDYEREQRNQFYVAAAERIAQLPGVNAAAVGTSAPFYSAISSDVYADGHDTIRAPGGRTPFIVSVTPDYFKTMGTRILRGRGFTADDRAGAPNVSVVNETMARMLWPGEEAIGKCLYVGLRSEKPPCSRIVGIAEEVKSMALTHDPVMTYYVPFAQRDRGLLALFIRSEGDPMRIVPMVQQAIHAGGPNLPYANVKLLQDLVDPHMRSWKLGAGLFSVFGALALLLAGLGLYSALSHAVANRTTEVGVRMALGARARDVVLMILRDGMMVAVLGVAAGILIAYFASRRAGPLLFDVTPHDPFSYAASAAVLLAVAFVAVLLPARRATKVDPAVALKSE